MSEPYIGMITTYGFSFAPRGWAQCNGQLLPISQNEALFSLLGTSYGGDGQSTFALPDLQGRTAVSTGQSPGTTMNWQLGQSVGVETVTLLTTQLPTHNHALNCVSGAANQQNPANHVTASELSGSTATYSDASRDTTMNGSSIGPAGGSQAHDNMQPFLVVNFCIATEGLYPSRS